MGAFRAGREFENPIEVQEEMRIASDRGNRYEAVLARGEVYTNGENAGLRCREDSAERGM